VGRKPCLLGASLLAAACGPRSEPAASAPATPPPPVVLRAVASAPAPALRWTFLAPPAATPQPATTPAVAAPATAPDPGAASELAGDDWTVGPPDPIPDCESRLAAAGVRFRAGALPLRQRPDGHVCGAPQVVVYERGPGEIRYNARPVASCGLALALARFELILQQEAQRQLGSRVTRIRQEGTYACRKMARYRSFVSEHSYANAIDISAFTLADGRRISIERHFGPTNQEPRSAEARFLRSLARRLYDEGAFSGVLTPYFDALHRNHFHFDLARYRADGTR
jgi:hypothetical protein